MRKTCRYITPAMFININAYACIYAGENMKRFTVSIPKSLKKKLDNMPEINWAEVAKKGVLNKLDSLEKFQMLENRGRL